MKQTISPGRSRPSRNRGDRRVNSNRHHGRVLRSLAKPNVHSRRMRSCRNGRIKKQMHHHTTNVRLHIHTYTHTYICAYVHTYIRAHIHVGGQAFMSSLQARVRLPGGIQSRLSEALMDSEEEEVDEC